MKERNQEFFFSFQSQSDLMVLHHVARILELSVPLMDHPSEGFLAQLEEDMMKLILKHGMMVRLSPCSSFVTSFLVIYGQVHLGTLSFTGLTELC